MHRFPLTSLLVVFLALGTSGFAADLAPTAPPAAAVKPGNFLIVMRLTPKYHAGAAWTDAADAVVQAHFTRLQEAMARGEVILAGRTDEPLDRTIGLIVFTAADENAARAFMENDPCVREGIMAATLHPYALALLQKE